MPEQKRETVRPAYEVRVSETGQLLGLVDIDAIRVPRFFVVTGRPKPYAPILPHGEIINEKPNYVRVELRQFQLRKGLVYLAWSVPLVAAYVVQTIPTFRLWSAWPLSFAGGEHVSSSTEGRFLGP